MADIFKDGILYMGDFHNSDIFEGIVEEQEAEKLLEEQKVIEDEESKKIKDIQVNINKCFKEINEKLKSAKNEILFENETIMASNGYGIEIIVNGNKKIVNMIIPKN